MVVESLTPLFCLMDLLYHFCLIFSIFPSSSSELNSKSSKTTTSAIIDAYNKIKDDLWKTWGSGTFIKTADINGPRYCAIGYKVDDNFGAFIMLYYAYDRPLYVRVSSGVWDVDNPKNI